MLVHLRQSFMLRLGLVLLLSLSDTCTQFNYFATSRGKQRLEHFLVTSLRSVLGDVRPITIAYGRPDSSPP
jgi:hypothetical protein